MPKLRDYYVSFAREETIADLAMEWRRAGGIATDAYFNVVHFVEQVLCPWLERQERPLHFNFFEVVEGEDLAYITVEPLTLNIDRELWELAGRGEPFARRVVCHEIGHIIQHGHYAKAAFSNGESAHMKAFVKWHSAEWQADQFMENFLLPTKLVAAFGCASQIAAACSVEVALAEKRFAEVHQNKLRQQYGTVVCPICGQFSCTEKH